MSARKHLIAVYGTLREGQGNHGILQRNQAVKLSEEVVSGFKMWNTGGFPAILAEPGDQNQITIEVYSASDETLIACDWLEGYSPERDTGMYYRRTVNTTQGVAFIYIWNGSIKGMDPIPSGDWNDRKARNYEFGRTKHGFGRI